MSKENTRPNFIKKHLYLSQLLLSYGLGFIATLVYVCSGDSASRNGLLLGILMISFFVAVFFVYPLVIACYQIILLIRASKSKELVKHTVGYDAWTLFLSLFYELIYLSTKKEVIFSANWQEQLRNAQIHTPIYTEAYISIAFLLMICITGLLILWMKSVNALAPLVTVLCISSIYLGVIFMLVWTVQIFKYKSITDLFLLLPTFVVILISVKTIMIKIREFVPNQNRISKINNIPILNRLNQFLMDAKRWPLMGFVFMLPLLAIIMLILLLFGQAPNSFIKAFTETSEWNLSQKISPQNIYYDEHYLCTVAAGGHKEIVKPLRKGIRHGHQVTVNRQLMIANAFEEIIEEKLPRSHKVIRGIYDRYGFPVARIIKSKWIADAIWIIMKPLEWIFLITIYLCDKHPEDRIAIQYTGKKVTDFHV